MTNAVVPDFGDIVLRRQSHSPRYIIEALLMDPKCFSEVKPYLLNGGVCGHKVMDLAHCVDIIRRYDKKLNGDDGALERFALNDHRVGNIFRNVIRQRYELDRQWKITDVNKKLTVSSE